MIAIALALVSALAGPARVAQEPALDLAGIRKQFAEAQDAFYATLDKVPAAEREKAYTEWGRQQEAFYDRAEALARSRTGSDEACEALVWIVADGGPGARSTRCFERLLADFPQSERLAEIPPAYVYVDQVFVEPWLTRLAEETRPAKVRGQALFSLAQHRLRAINGAQRLKSDPEAAQRLRARWPADWCAKLDALDPEAETRAVEALLERVARDFGAIETSRSTLGKLASGSLFELRNLAIGKTAPEIEGSDLEGVAFKLSDYRGKVVLLDFWGHW